MLYPHLSFERAFLVFGTGLYILAVTVGLFTGGTWALLGIGGSLIASVNVWWHDRKFPFMHCNVLLFTGIVLAILASEIPFSSNVGLSVKTWGRLASIFLPLLFLLSPRVQGAILAPSSLKPIALAMGVGAIALALELGSGGVLLTHFKHPGAGLTEYNRGIAHGVILSFPLLGGLWVYGNKKAAVLLFLILILPASLTESRTTKLALTAGVAVSGLAWALPAAARFGAALGSAALLGWPFYARALFKAAHDVVLQMPDSWQQRVEIWDALSYRIAERPLLGWGLGTTPTLDMIQPHGALYQWLKGQAPHAHNFITQLWVEAGIPGLALGALFMVLVLRAIQRLDTRLRPFASGAYVTAVAISLMGFNFWTDALWAAFALTAGLFGMLQQALQGRKNRIDG